MAAKTTAKPLNLHNELDLEDTAAVKMAAFKIIRGFLDKEKRTFKADEHTKALYHALCLYFSNHPEFETLHTLTKSGDKIAFNLRRGLLITGISGVGKSFAFRVFQTFANKWNQEASFIWVDSLEVMEAVEKNGMKGLNKLVYKQNTTGYEYSDLYIDDIGYEAATVKNWGNDLQPISWLLFKRNDLAFRHPIRTHVTTNLSLGELKAKYGNRVYSRLFRMFNIIELKGQDKGIDLIQ